MILPMESDRSDAPYGGSNFTDRTGARVLKERIEAYWRERGFEIQVNLVEAPFSPAIRAARVDIRSELINGLPKACRPRPQSDD